jgi:hypothetical protein
MGVYKRENPGQEVDCAGSRFQTNSMFGSCLSATHKKGIPYVVDERNDDERIVPGQAHLEAPHGEPLGGPEGVASESARGIFIFDKLEVRCRADVSCVQ